MIYTHDFIEQLNTSSLYERAIRYNQSKFSAHVLEEHGAFMIRDRRKMPINEKKFTFESTPSIKGTVHTLVNSIDDATNRSGMAVNNKFNVVFHKVTPTFDYYQKGMMMRWR